jgi:hypothetical protein
MIFVVNVLIRQSIELQCSALFAGKRSFVRISILLHPIFIFDDMDDLIHKFEGWQ